MGLTASPRHHTIRERILAANDEMEGLALAANEILAASVGSFIDGMSFQMMGDRDLYGLTLRVGPGKPDVVIALGCVYRISVGKPPDAVGSFVDEARVSLLPQHPALWPDGAEELVRRHENLPNLFWLKVIGPTTVDVVGANLSVSLAHAYL
jgi:hypothetical protein